MEGYKLDRHNAKSAVYIYYMGIIEELLFDINTHISQGGLSVRSEIGALVLTLSLTRFIAVANCV